MDRGRGFKGVDGCNVKEIREIQRSEVVDSFEGKEKFRCSFKLVLNLEILKQVLIVHCFIH